MAEAGAAGDNGRTQISNSQQGGNPGSNGESGQINGASPKEDKDKPPDLLVPVADSQSGGTLFAMTADSSGHLGVGSNGGPMPLVDSMDNEREGKKWSSLFGSRPTGKY